MKTIPSSLKGLRSQPLVAPPGETNEVVRTKGPADMPEWYRQRQIDLIDTIKALSPKTSDGLDH